MIVATAGHVDHGKTLLVKALTGTDTDRLPEEKKRGLTIDLGFAYWQPADGPVIGFVDVPGHERFVRNMLAGVGIVDIALLVVAADDGVMPQTLEHLAILDLLGISTGVVALTKIDRVDPARVDEVADAVRAVLSGTGLAKAPVFPLSARTGDGVAELAAHLEGVARTLAARDARGHFRLAVDRCFTIAGAGLVVTGSVFSGRVTVGDTMVLSPRGIAGRVRGLHAQNRQAETARAGQRCALNLVGAELDKDHVHRGDWVLSEAAHAPTARFDAELRVLAGETRALKHWTPMHLHLGAADVTCRVAVLEGGRIAPGETGLAQLVLDHAIGALAGDRFILRDQSARRTVAGGRIIDPFAPARGRARPARLGQLDALRHENPAAALAGLVAAVPEGVDLDRFALARNLRADEAAGVFDTVDMAVLEAADGPVGMAPDSHDRLLSNYTAALAAWHQRQPDSLGPDADALRRAVQPRVTDAVFAAITRSLLENGKIARRGTIVHLPDHRPEPTPADAALWRKVEPLLAAGGARPPRVRELAEALDMDLKPLEAYLARAAQLGVIVRVTHNRVYPPAAVLDLARVAEALAADGPFTAGDFRDRSGIGRNLTIEVLEFFDHAGFTHRTGEKRRVFRAASDIFGAERG